MLEHKSMEGKDGGEAEWKGAIPGPTLSSLRSPQIVAKHAQHGLSRKTWVIHPIPEINEKGRPREWRRV